MKKFFSILVIMVALLAISVPFVFAKPPDIEVGDVSYYFCPLGECSTSHCWIYYPVMNGDAVAMDNGGCFDVGQITYCSCHDTPEYCAMMTYCSVSVPEIQDGVAE